AGNANTNFSEQAKIQYDGCVYALEEMRKPIRDFRFRNIGTPVNTDKSDYGPVIGENDSSLVITSARKGSTGKEMYHKTGETFSDNFRFAKGEKGWREVNKNDNFERINTARNDGAGVFSKDKMKYYYTQCNEPDGNCAIYVTRFVSKGKSSKSTWQKPVKLNDNVNMPGQWNAQPSLSANDDTLFFVSKRPGGYGMLDIWYCVTTGNEDGWAEAKNIGSNINTPFIDMSPYYYAEDKVLFFASNGHKGFGGLDIFMAKGDNFGEVKNIGLPFNSNRDDFYFVTGKEIGYLSSNREGGLGNDDIYVFDKTTKRSVIAVINVDPLTGDETISIEGQILNDDDQQAAKDIPIQLVDKDGFIFKWLKTDSEGRFKFENLPADKNFTVCLSEKFDGTLDIFALSKYTADNININVFSKKGKFIFVNLPGEKIYKLNLTEGEFLAAYEKFVKDTTKIKIEEFEYVLLSSSELKKINLMIDGSKLTADGKYIIDGVTIGQYNKEGAFVFVNLTPDEIKKLSSSDAISLTAKGKFVVDGVVIGEYDKDNKFHFTELSTDELIKLSLTEEQVLAERKTYTVNDVSIGIFEEGKFKFINLSADVINKIGLIDESMVTAEKKYRIADITIGEFDENEIFTFKNLTPDEIVKLSMVKGSNITAEGKYVVDGTVIGSWNEAGVFSFENLAADEITKLGLMQDTNFVALLKKFIGDVGIMPSAEKKYFENIYFNYKSDTVRPEAVKVLNDLVAYYKQNPGFRIEIYANTDSKGPEVYNMQLSQKRGNSAMAYLISESVDKNEIVVYSMGESRQIASNETDIVRQLNRRVQFNLVGNVSSRGEITYHVVEEEQTLYTISRMYNLPVNEIKALNALVSEKVSLGLRLIVIKRDVTPGEVTKDGYIVKEGDTMFSIAERFGLTTKELKEMNNLGDNVIFQYMVLKVVKEEE
ncbi:MAG: LysM peptidoglycan-binding domain-containing protein, partial [Bacteroidetes bacterium]|nr:LysM peptidoglycan-binding domain-containing protein [Bacteroidota bacterium]